MSMNNIVLIAMSDEAPELASLCNVFFTGVGKVNAAATAAEVIVKYRPQRIINFGTAGGITVGPGFYQCTRFVQRDMHCEALGCKSGQTLGESHLYLGHAQGLTCSTGDDFVINPQLAIGADVVDMEAYAIARACERLGVEFLCWKYISDQANQDANTEWQQQVSAGQHHYLAKMQALGLL